MFGRLFRRTTPEEQFWKWFETDQENYCLLNGDQERLFDALALELKKVNPELTFQFGPVVDGKREFIISAGGITSALSAVINLVKIAPALPKWNIIPFVPRSRDKLTINYRSANLDSEDVVFSCEMMPGAKIDVVLYAASFSGVEGEDAQGAAFLLLDTILGEYDVATKLGSIEFKPLAEAAEGVLPLERLPEIVDRHFPKQ